MPAMVPFRVNPVSAVIARLLSEDVAIFRLSLRWKPLPKQSIFLTFTALFFLALLLKKELIKLKLSRIKQRVMTHLK